MADKQTDDRQAAGRSKVLRGIILVLCLIVLAVFVTLWIKLASKDIKIEVATQQPSTEQSAATSEDKTARTGKWYVSLASFRLERDAAAMVKRYAEKGVKTDYISFVGTRKKYQWYRVRVAGFASEQEAQEQLVVLSKKLGIRTAWVGETF
jgi:cell division septation protein DedD